MASREQTTIGSALETIPPMDGAILVGYALVAEWEEPSGQRLLTRLLGDRGNPWQAKGYFYDGMTMSWPEQLQEEPGLHHNPGHPPGWMTIGD